MPNYFAGVENDEPIVNFIKFESGARFYALTTAITANSTSVPAGAAAGSLGITTNATGIGAVFYSDGSKWQNIA
jgi:hypothetical protein